MLVTGLFVPVFHKFCSRGGWTLGLCAYAQHNETSATVLNHPGTAKQFQLLCENANQSPVLNCNLTFVRSFVSTKEIITYDFVSTKERTSLTSRPRVTFAFVLLSFLFLNAHANREIRSMKNPPNSKLFLMSVSKKSICHGRSTVRLQLYWSQAIKWFPHNYSLNCIIVVTSTASGGHVRSSILQRGPATFLLAHGVEKLARSFLGRVMRLSVNMGLSWPELLSEHDEDQVGANDRPATGGDNRAIAPRNFQKHCEIVNTFFSCYLCNKLQWFCFSSKIFAGFGPVGWGTGNLCITNPCHDVALSVSTCIG